MRYFASGDESGKNPDWYWKRGLHDAEITGVEERELDYDYTQPNPVRSCMTIRLDAKNAMFDIGVTAIHLYNYKVVRDESGTGGYGDGLEGCYWMQDRLRFENGKYCLEITALGEEDFLYVVRFDFALSQIGPKGRSGSADPGTG